jgi:hypothetical protein
MAGPVNRSEGGFDDYSGWGVTAADFDGDGLPDLLLTDHAVLQLWRGDPAGGLVPGPAPVRAGEGIALAAVAGDLDGDGDLDAVLSAAGGDELLINDGTGRLTGRLGDPAVFSSEGGKFSLTLGDVDGEGSRLALNDGTGAFTSGDAALPAAANVGYPFTTALVDTDDDGDPDLLLANDHGNRARPSQHWRNDGGTSIDVSAETAADLRLTAMGLGLGDLAGDGTLDVAVSGTRELALMEGDGAGVFVQTGAARGYEPDLDAGQHVAWGVEMGDVDNDGRLDVFTAYGWFPTDPEHDPLQPDSLHLQGEDGRLSDVAPDWGLDDTGWGRGALLVDLDRDGWLDLVRRRVHDLPTVHLARCGDAGWLRVVLRDAGPNTHAVGARIEVEAGGAGADAHGARRRALHRQQRPPRGPLRPRRRDRRGPRPDPLARRRHVRARGHRHAPGALRAAEPLSDRLRAARAARAAPRPRPAGAAPRPGRADRHRRSGHPAVSRARSHAPTT